jgi:hypothetical protein
MWIQFFRPRTSGRIEFSARLFGLVPSAETKI